MDKRGRLLSLYDKADRMAGTCQEAFSASSQIDSKEIVFNTARGMGFSTRRSRYGSRKWPCGQVHSLREPTVWQRWGWKCFRILDFLMPLLYHICISSSSRPLSKTPRKDALPSVWQNIAVPLKGLELKSDEQSKYGNIKDLTKCVQAPGLMSSGCGFQE